MRRRRQRRQTRLSDVLIVATLYVLVIVMYLAGLGESDSRKGITVLVTAPLILPLCAFKAVQILRSRSRDREEVQP